MIITDRCVERLTQLINGNGELTIKHFAVGNGGTPEGTEISPLSSMTALVNEVYRREVSCIYNDMRAPNVKLIDCEVPGSAGPFWMTEVGLFDDGAENSGVPELMAIGGYPKTQKMAPAPDVENDYVITCALKLTPDQNAAIEIKVDPNIHLINNHQHTGSDGTLQVEHGNLLGVGALSHAEIESKLDFLTPRCLFDEDEVGTGTHSVSFYRNGPDQKYEIAASAVFGGNYSGQIASHEIGLSLFAMKPGTQIELANWRKSTSQHYDSLIGEQTIHWAGRLAPEIDVIGFRTGHTWGVVKNRRIKLTPIVY